VALLDIVGYHPTGMAHYVFAAAGAAFVVGLGYFFKKRASQEPHTS
jgi:LPXTG-motif cell wall-anchored protein